LNASKADLLALPAALDAFNGFYETLGSFVLVAPSRLLWLAGLGALLVAGAFVWLVVFVPCPLVLNEGLLHTLHLWPENEIVTKRIVDGGHVAGRYGAAKRAAGRQNLSSVDQR